MILLFVKGTMRRGGIFLHFQVLLLIQGSSKVVELVLGS